VLNAINQSLSSPLFTANLNHNAPGSYNFGFIDDSEYNGTITYTGVDDLQGFWAFDPTIEGTNQNGSIADTGTTLLMVDDSIVTAYYNQVPGATNSATDGGYIFDCSSTLPDVSVAIEGVTFTIPGNIINFAPAQNPASCFGGLQANTGIGFSIFGDIFLKSVFVVFEQDQDSPPRLGFATKTITS
jgi:aspergillopepsin I